MQVLNGSNASIEAQQGPGHTAQGVAVAQLVIASIKAHARDLRRCVADLFTLAVPARAEAAKAMRKFREECVKNAQQNNNVEGFTPKAWRKMANSATTRISHMNTIIKAMNAGFTMNTLAEAANVGDPENVGFDMVYEYAKAYAASQAKGDTRGRKTKAFMLKLKDFLDKTPAIAGDDSESKQRVLERIADLLAG